jgi:hypothetical protein
LSSKPDPDPNPDPKLNPKPDPDPKIIISDPQHCVNPLKILWNEPEGISNPPTNYSEDTGNFYA